ncbi:MAG: hypothetical protein MPJ24_04335 [Pirellulaceae bacterium]|nr:hypothetical protein [Pirellulaceae bacterium]
MWFEFEFGRPATHCCECGKSLSPGGRCVSALVRRHGILRRQDRCPSCWSGPDADMSAWWEFDLPQVISGKSVTPNEMLWQYFDARYEREELDAETYLLSLLLLRKRVLAMVQNSDQRRGQEYLALRHPESDKTYFVPVCQPATEELEGLESRLYEILYPRSGDDFQGKQVA